MYTCVCMCSNANVKLDDIYKTMYTTINVLRHYITICVYQKYDRRGHKNKKVHGLLICEVYESL